MRSASPATGACSLCGSPIPKLGCPQCELRQPSLFSLPMPPLTDEDIAAGDADRAAARKEPLERERRADRVRDLAALGRPARIGLVGCAKTKRRESSAARELYVSDLFRASLEYAELAFAEVFILSAFHGLVNPDQVIAPYEYKLEDLPKRERLAWGDRVASALALRLPRLHLQLVFLAGVAYAAPVQSAAIRYGWLSEQPLRGMPIGRRKRWFEAEAAKLRAARAPARRRRSR